MLVACTVAAIAASGVEFVKVKLAKQPVRVLRIVIVMLAAQGSGVKLKTIWSVPDGNVVELVIVAVPPETVREAGSKPVPKIVTVVGTPPGPLAGVGPDVIAVITIAKIGPSAVSPVEMFVTETTPPPSQTMGAITRISVPVTEVTVAA